MRTNFFHFCSDHLCRFRNVAVADVCIHILFLHLLFQNSNKASTTNRQSDAKLIPIFVEVLQIL